MKGRAPEHKGKRTPWKTDAGPALIVFTGNLLKGGKKRDTGTTRPLFARVAGQGGKKDALREKKRKKARRQGRKPLRQRGKKSWWKTSRRRPKKVKKKGGRYRRKFPGKRESSRRARPMKKKKKNGPTPGAGPVPQLECRSARKKGHPRLIQKERKKRTNLGKRESRIKRSTSPEWRVLVERSGKKEFDKNLPPGEKFVPARLSRPVKISSCRTRSISKRSPRKSPSTPRLIKTVKNRG